jgi:hypothetical protein
LQAAWDAYARYGEGMTTQSCALLRTCFGDELEPAWKVTLSTQAGLEGCGGSTDNSEIGLFGRECLPILSGFLPKDKNDRNVHER